VAKDTEPVKRLFLLDGHSLSYRAFFALPTTLAPLRVTAPAKYIHGRSPR